MNQKLIDAIRKKDTDTVLHMVAQSADKYNQLINSLTREETLSIINLAAGYIAAATRMVVANPSLDNKWGEIFSTSVINTGTREIIDNPAAPEFTLAIMIITAALMDEVECQPSSN